MAIRTHDGGDNPRRQNTRQPGRDIELQQFEQHAGIVGTGDAVEERRQLGLERGIGDLRNHLRKSGDKRGAALECPFWAVYLEVSTFSFTWSSSVERADPSHFSIRQ